MLKALWIWFSGWLRGGPHFVVGQAGNAYLLRWYIVPRNPWFNIYLHKFLRDDDDRALHDHPWRSLSICLAGEYDEIVAGGRRIRRRRGDLVRREPESAHRVELPAGPAWTLFFTGRVVREWGFHCPKGWVSWKQFVKPAAPGEIGAGCGEA